MAKPRAEVSNGGLARRLGEEITLKREVKQIRGEIHIGKLVHYPSSFGILLDNEQTIPLRDGDIVQLRTGGQFPYMRDYVYREQSCEI